MIVANLKMTLTVEIPVPLGSMTREDAERELSTEAARAELSAAMLEQAKANLGAAGSVSLIDCTINVAEI